MSFEVITENTELHPEGEITNLHTKKLEQKIQKRPDLWLWSHRRWKHKKNSSCYIKLQWDTLAKKILGDVVIKSPEAEIWVADNSSTDNSISYLQKKSSLSKNYTIKRMRALLEVTIKP